MERKKDLKLGEYTFTFFTKYFLLMVETEGDGTFTRVQIAVSALIICANEEKIRKGVARERRRNLFFE
jgi:hypothetical protein